MKEFGLVKYDEESGSNYVEIRGTGDQLDQAIRDIRTWNLKVKGGIFQTIWSFEWSFDVQEGQVEKWSGRIDFREGDHRTLVEKLNSLHWAFNSDL